MVRREWYKTIRKSDESTDLSDGIARALRQRHDTKVMCEFCGSRVLTYQGLGVYVCADCKKETLTDYGKVRAYLDEVGTCSASELMKATGLSKSDLEALINSGSIAYREGGMLKAKDI